MKNDYKTLLNIALSCESIEYKVSQLSLLWEAIIEAKLFKYAETDEVASHIAFILKKSNVAYASYWDDVYHSVDKRITVMMRLLDEVAEELRKHRIQVTEYRIWTTDDTMLVTRCDP